MGNSRLIRTHLGNRDYLVTGNYPELSGNSYILILKVPQSLVSKKDYFLLGFISSRGLFHYVGVRKIDHRKIVERF